MAIFIARRDFVKGAAAAALAGAADFAGAAGLEGSSPARRSAVDQSELITKFNDATEAVEKETYREYLRTSQTQGYWALDELEKAFDKVLDEARSTVVKPGGVPAVWSVYNMGYIVKTSAAMFSIDLVHRRDAEFAQYLDFALITHNHGDHWRQGFYSKMNNAGKIVISNFLDNYGAYFDPGAKMARGGFTRAEKIFRFKDVDIRTSLIDHNEYLLDYTTAFEIKVGNFTIYHTGDSGRGTVPKLHTVYKRPDLWLFFPGCGINVASAVRKIKAKRIVFGHLWEMGHPNGGRGRLDKGGIMRGFAGAEKGGCKDVSVAFWGDRIV